MADIVLASEAPTETQDGACRRWAEKAMGLAALGEDERRLHRLLQEKYFGLAWDR
ncbi:MAG: hypothetical protein Q9182_005718 [Xanthomendoza sp. 2 TL-2023]